VHAAEVTSFMPEPGGLRLADVESLFTRLRGEATVLGAGVSGLAPDERNVAPVTRLLGSLGL
jgi:hypothetical protein